MQQYTYGQLESQAKHLEDALRSLIDALKFNLCPDCEDEFLSARKQLRKKINDIYTEIDRRESQGNWDGKKMVA